jgi:hypothetical protein
MNELTLREFDNDPNQFANTILRYANNVIILRTVNFDPSYAQQIYPEQKAKMCNPNNPKLDFVNSTESKICGIPESVKNQTTTTSMTKNSSTTTAPQTLTSSARPPL